METQIAVVIKGGVVVAYVSAGQPLTLRVIDLDAKKAIDYQPEACSIDIEEYTLQTMKW